jgi:hypothetical protein
MQQYMCMIIYTQGTAAGSTLLQDLQAEPQVGKKRCAAVHAADAHVRYIQLR